MSEASEDDPLEVRYTWPVRIAVAVAPVMLGGLGILVWWVAQDMWSSPFVVPILMGALGSWFLYIAYLAIRALPFLDVSIGIQDWGLEIARGGRIRRLAWDEIGAVRRDSLHQVLTVRDHAGCIVVIVDYKIRGFHGLDSALLEQVHRRRHEPAT